MKLPLWLFIFIFLQTKFGDYCWIQLDFLLRLNLNNDIVLPCFFEKFLGMTSYLLSCSGWNFGLNYRPLPSIYFKAYIMNKLRNLMNIKINILTINKLLLLYTCPFARKLLLWVSLLKLWKDHQWPFDTVKYSLLWLFSLIKIARALNFLWTYNLVAFKLI